MIDSASSSDAGTLGTPPRRLRLRRRFRVLRWTLVFATILPSTALLALGWSEGAVLEQLARDGAIATGQITDKRAASGRGANFRLTATFTVDGNTYEVGDSVPPQRYHAATVGGPVEVTYLPADPSTSRLDRIDVERITRTKAAFFWGAFASGVAFGGTLLLFERYARRLLGLARHGEAALGTIVVPTRRRRGAHYVFRDANGREHRGRSTFRGAIPAGCAPGCVATVLFDSVRPSRSALLASIEEVVVVPRARDGH